MGARNRHEDEDTVGKKDASWGRRSKPSYQNQKKLQR